MPRVEEGEALAPSCASTESSRLQIDTATPRWRGPREWPCRASPRHPETPGVCALPVRVLSEVASPFCETEGCKVRHTGQTLVVLVFEPAPRYPAFGSAHTAPNRAGVCGRFAGSAADSGVAIAGPVGAVGPVWSGPPRKDRGSFARSITSVPKSKVCIESDRNNIGGASSEWWAAAAAWCERLDVDITGDLVGEGVDVSVAEYASGLGDVGLGRG